MNSYYLRSFLAKKDCEKKRKLSPNPQRPEKAYLSQLEDMFISFLVAFSRRVKKINYIAERCASNIFVPSAYAGVIKLEAI